MPKEACRESQKCLQMYEHSHLAHRQWTRLLGSMLSTAISSEPLESFTGPGHPSSVSATGGISNGGIPVVDPAIARILARNNITNTHCSDRRSCGLGNKHLPGTNVTDSNRQSSNPRWSDEEPIASNGYASSCDECCIKNGYIEPYIDCNPDGRMAWRRADKIYPQGLEGLHEEMHDFYAYIRPSEEEKNIRINVIDRLKQAVMELWPDAKIEVFGSFRTELYLPTSDIDLVVLCPWEPNPFSALTKLETLLNDKGEYEDIKLIKSSVPIVKFVDRETGIKVDVGWTTQSGTHLGTKGAQFVKEKIAEFPQLPILVVVLKQCLLFNNLLESFNGGISSYCLILLVIGYLQLHPNDQQKGHAYMLIKFLELYGQRFNFQKTGIRIRDGGGYFNKDEENGVEIENRYSLLCIEDPLNPSNNVGQACYGILMVRDLFNHAFKELRDACLPQFKASKPASLCSTSILGSILLIPHEICAYRRIMKAKYATTPPVCHPQQYSVPPPSLALLHHGRPQIGDSLMNMPAMLPLSIQIQEGNAAGGNHCVVATPTGSSDDRSDVDSVGSQTSNNSKSCSQSSESCSITSGGGPGSGTESDVQPIISRVTRIIDTQRRQNPHSLSPKSPIPATSMCDVDAPLLPSTSTSPIASLSSVSSRIVTIPQSSSTDSLTTVSATGPISSYSTRVTAAFVDRGSNHSGGSHQTTNGGPGNVRHFTNSMYHSANRGQATVANATTSASGAASSVAPGATAKPSPVARPPGRRKGSSNALIRSGNNGGKHSGNNGLGPAR